MLIRNEEFKKRIGRLALMIDSLKRQEQGEQREPFHSSRCSASSVQTLAAFAIYLHL